MMISFIKLIRFHCRCLSCSGGPDKHQTLLSYMLMNSIGLVVHRSGTALFKQSCQIMSREQSQSAREWWGKRSRALSQ